MHLPALAAILSLAGIPLVLGDGCYSGGEAWGDVASETDLATQRTNFCAAAATEYAYNQVFDQCYNFASGNSVHFQVKNTGGNSGSTLTKDDCIAALTTEMNACGTGSEQQHGDFHYVDDPNAGVC